MKAFESTGFWCVPEQPDHLVAGTLHVSSSGEVRLSLIGELGGGEQVEPGKKYRVIHGCVSESPKGNAVTLFGCVLTGSSFGSYHGRREKYRAGRAFFGAHLTQDEEFSFRHVSLRIGGLPAWCDSISGLLKGQTKLPTSQDAGKMVPVASYLVPEKLSGKIKGGEVSLHMTVGTRSALNKFRIHEEANILFDFDQPKPMGEIDAQYIYPIQNMLTFASDRPQNVESITVWCGEDLSDWDHNPEIRVIGSRVQPEQEEEPEKETRSDEMIFTLADVDFAPFIGQWLQLAERYADVFNIYFGIQYAQPAFVDMTYGVVAQSLALFFARSDDGVKQVVEEERRLKRVVRALPGPDADWLIGHLGVRPQPSFSSILQQLVSKHGPVIDPLIAQRREAFVNQSATTLRFLESRDGEERNAAAKGIELYWLTQKQRFLLRACMLSELGFEQEKVIGMLKRDPYFRHIADLEMTKSGKEPAAKELEISFQFVVPSDGVLATASRMAESSIADEKSVGRCILDLTEVVLKTKAAVENVESEENFDLSVLFDFDTGDSLEAAERLASSTDHDVQQVAKTLISQVDAIGTSKTSFLRASKA